MTVELHALRFAAHDPVSLGRFWAVLLRDQTVTIGDDRVELPPLAEPGLQLAFVATTTVRQVRNHMHLDLTSESETDQQELVERALALGAAPCDVGQTGDEGHVVLTDPEGNEFCVIEPGNAFLAGTGPIGAVAGDGTRACGLFWTAALDWPLVWDEGQETAIQSPVGGPKLTWGGPPLMPTDGQDRVRYELRVVDGPVSDELARLERLGAARDGADARGSVLRDPDGHAFSLAG